MHNIVKAIVISGVAGLALVGCEAENEVPVAEETTMAPVEPVAPVADPMATGTMAPDGTMMDGAMATDPAAPAATETPAM